jgi:hypothetical protein
MTTPIIFEDSGCAERFNAPPVAIHFTIPASEYYGKSYGGFFPFQHDAIIIEGSALVDSRRNESSRPLREILGGAN